MIWPRWCEGALAEIDEFVSADLRHQWASEDDLRTHPAVSDLVRETYAAMLELVENPDEGSVLRRLDAVCARFDSAEAIFDHPMRELEEKVRSARAQAPADRTELTLQLAAARSERNSLSERIAEANRDIARAESIIGHIANRFAEKRRPSKSTWFRYFWKTGSKSATPSFVTRRTSRPFAIQSFSVPRINSERTRTFAPQGWTLRSTTCFTAALKAGTPDRFSRQRRIWLDTLMSPRRASTPSCITKHTAAGKVEEFVCEPKSTFSTGTTILDPE